MDNEYSFNSKVVEDAIVNLKSSFFDIYSHQTTALANLQSGMERLSPANREKVEAMILAQSEKLTHSMLLINEVVKNVEAVDANGLKVEKLINSTKRPSKAAQLVKTGETKKESVEQKTEPATEVSTEVATEAATEAVQVTVVEQKTEPATEVSTEVTTEAATEAVQVPAVEQKTEPTTEASTEVTTEAATESVQVPAVEQKTEQTTEASTEVTTEAATEAVQVPVVEEKTEPATEVDVNPVIIPAANATDGTSIFDTPPTEPEVKKEYIADTPEQVNLDMFNMFKSLPGMENLKMNANGNPDFSAVLPEDIVQKIKSSGDTSLSGIISAIARENKAQSGIVDPVLPVIATEGDSQDNGGVTGEENNEVSTEAALVEATTEAVQQTVDASEPVIIPTIAPPSAPASSVVAVNDITNEIGDALNNLEISTEVATEVTQEIIPLSVDDTNGQEVVSTDVVNEVVAENMEHVAVDETGYRRFVDSGGEAKAILVSEVQYNKLVSSNVTQEALLKFKHILPETSTPVKVKTDAADMSDEEKSKMIESMMADANALYNSGKVQEAQAMYDKIVELNKTLVKN